MCLNYWQISYLNLNFEWSILWSVFVKCDQVLLRLGFKKVLFFHDFCHKGVEGVSSAMNVFFQICFCLKGESQYSPPQDCPLGGQSWGGEYWYPGISTLPTLVITLFFCLICLYHASRIVQTQSLISLKCWSEDKPPYESICAHLGGCTKSSKAEQGEVVTRQQTPSSEVLLSPSQSPVKRIQRLCDVRGRGRARGARGGRMRRARGARGRGNAPLYR